MADYQSYPGLLICQDNLPWAAQLMVPGDVGCVALDRAANGSVACALMAKRSCLECELGRHVG